jgi:hypothetical protein
MNRRMSMVLALHDNYFGWAFPGIFFGDSHLKFFQRSKWIYPCRLEASRQSANLESTRRPE